MYEPRTYRSLHREKDLRRFRVLLGETDLDIAVKKEACNAELFKKTEAFVFEKRQILKEYIARDKVFLETLEPYQALPSAPPEVREMCEKAALAGVGPMACVAGLISEMTGFFLARYSEDVIVENGGDIWMQSGRKRVVSVFAGDSPFSYRIGLEIHPRQTPLGICTSSGTVGHSLSFGRADALVILAPSAVLADAVATAACNLVKREADLEEAVQFALDIPGVTGALAIMGDKMAARGNIKLTPLHV